MKQTQRYSKWLQINRWKISNRLSRWHESISFWISFVVTDQSSGNKLEMLLGPFFKMELWHNQTLQILNYATYSNLGIDKEISFTSGSVLHINTIVQTKRLKLWSLEKKTPHRNHSVKKYIVDHEDFWG